MYYVSGDGMYPGLAIAISCNVHLLRPYTLAWTFYYNAKYYTGGEKKSSFCQNTWLIVNQLDNPF